MVAVESFAFNTTPYLIVQWAVIPFLYSILIMVVNQEPSWLIMEIRDDTMADMVFLLASDLLFPVVLHTRGCDIGDVTGCRDDDDLSA